MKISRSNLKSMNDISIFDLIFKLILQPMTSFHHLGVLGFWGFGVLPIKLIKNTQKWIFEGLVWLYLVW